MKKMKINIERQKDQIKIYSKENDFLKRMIIYIRNNKNIFNNN
jgi:hypothetical protein